MSDSLRVAVEDLTERLEAAEERLHHHEREIHATINHHTACGLQVDRLEVAVGQAAKLVDKLHLLIAEMGGDE